MRGISILNKLAVRVHSASYARGNLLLTDTVTPLTVSHLRAIQCRGTDTKRLAS